MDQLMKIDINSYLGKIVGRKVVQARPGIGSFMIMDFAFHEGESYVGDWHLWVQHCAWRIEYDNAVLVSAEFENRPQFQKIMEQLNGSKVVEARVDGICNDLSMKFSNGYALKTFTYIDYDVYSSWEFFMSDNNVLTVGPGVKVRYGSASEPAYTDLDDEG